MEKKKKLKERGVDGDGGVDDLLLYFGEHVDAFLTMTFLPEGGVAVVAEEGSQTSELGGFMASPP